MKNITTGVRNSVFTTLRRLAKDPKANEQCEFCSIALDFNHRHVLEIATRKIICACDPCGLLFEKVIGGRKLVPSDNYSLPDFQITDEQWETLALPIGLAFFYSSSVARRIVAMYPSPAGATESLLPLRSWETLRNANPILAIIEPDVEALLVNRLGEVREYYIAPIDTCYELVGLIRLHWKGFSGGDLVFHKLAEFFDKVRESARLPRERAWAGARNNSPIQSIASMKADETTVLR
jgi:hypothetical protein